MLLPFLNMFLPLSALSYIYLELLDPKYVREAFIKIIKTFPSPQCDKFTFLMDCVIHPSVHFDTLGIPRKENMALFSSSSRGDTLSMKYST